MPQRYPFGTLRRRKWINYTNAVNYDNGIERLPAMSEELLTAKRAGERQLTLSGCRRSLPPPPKKAPAWVNLADEEVAQASFHHEVPTPRTRGLVALAIDIAIAARERETSQRWRLQVQMQRLCNYVRSFAAQSDGVQGLGLSDIPNAILLVAGDGESDFFSFSPTRHFFFCYSCDTWVLEGALQLPFYTLRNQAPWDTIECSRNVQRFHP